MSKIDVLDLESIMIDNKSLEAILEDGVVTEQEILEQSRKVTDIAGRLQEMCSDDQLALIRSLIAEMNALYVAYNYNELLSIK